MSEPQYQHLQCRTEEGVLVLTIVDKQMRSDELADALRAEFLMAVAVAGIQKVAIDLQNVEYLSSAGIRPLLSLRRHLHGGRLVLCNLAPLIDEVLHATRLISTSGAYLVPFESAADVPAAVALLKSAAPDK